MIAPSQTEGGAEYSRDSTTSLVAAITGNLVVVCHKASTCSVSGGCSSYCLIL
jgi:hypothetical protein